MANGRNEFKCLLVFVFMCISLPLLGDVVMRGYSGCVGSCSILPSLALQRRDKTRSTVSC